MEERVVRVGARKIGRSPLTMPEPINGTPENAAKAILSTPPKKRNEWKFMQRTNSADNWPAPPAHSGEGNE